MSEEIFISTESIDSDIRTDFYRSLFSSFLDITPVDQNPLSGSIHIRSVDHWTMTHWKFGLQHCHRRPNLILQADIDAYLLILITKGYFNSTTKNTSTLLNVGDLILINTSQVNSSISAGESMSLYIPRTELEQHMGHYRIPNEVILKAKQPMTQLLTDYMLSLFNVALDLKPRESNPAFEALLSLLAVRLKNGKMPIHQEVNTVLKWRIQQYIDLNIKSPDLGIEKLMSRFNVSRAHLYRAFEAEGGIATFIRNKRLDRIYCELIDQDFSTSILTEISQAYGFNNSSQFLRAFRLRFGMSPMEVQGHYLDQEPDQLDLKPYFIMQRP